MEDFIRSIEYQSATEKIDQKFSYKLRILQTCLYLCTPVVTVVRRPTSNMVQSVREASFQTCRTYNYSHRIMSQQNCVWNGVSTDKIHPEMQIILCQLDVTGTSLWSRLVIESILSFVTFRKENIMMLTRQKMFLLAVQGLKENRMKITRSGMLV